MKKWLHIIGFLALLLWGVSVSAAEPTKQTFITGGSFPDLTTVDYVPFNNYNKVASVFAAVSTSTPVSVPGTLSGGTCYTPTAPGVGKSWVGTVMVDLASTTGTCTISDTATSSPVIGAVTVKAGDTWLVAFAPIGTPARTASVEMTSDFQANNYNNFTYGGAALNVGTGTGELYNGFSADTSSAPPGSANATTTIATRGTFDQMWFSAVGNPGVGKTTNGYLVLNSATTSLTAGVTGNTIPASVSGSDLTHSVSVVEGDNVQIAREFIGTPGVNGRMNGYAFRFIPTTPGDAMYFSGVRANTDDGTQTNWWPVQGTAATTTAEANVQQQDTAKTYKGIYVTIGTRAAATKSRTFTLNVNGIPTAITCTIPAATGFCSLLGQSVTINAGDLVDVEEDTTNSPANSTVGITLVYSKFSQPVSAQHNFVGGKVSFNGGQHTFGPKGYIDATFLLVGGGAGTASGGFSGGGGGGGYLAGPVRVYSGSYTVTIGAGGAANANGSNSVFGTITALGGGKSNAATNNAGSNGGSGGGGSFGNGSTPAGGVGSQGFNGGNGFDAGATAQRGGGGGGGAGHAGANATSGIGGNGGAGISNSITGSAVSYAGGGGGASGDNSTATTGGTGGGGNGGVTASNGTANRGGGAGNGFGVGASGGSGKFVFSYPTGTATTTGGIVSSSGTNTVVQFNSSGTLGISVY